MPKETNADGSRSGVGFKERGRKLWVDTLATGTLTPAELTLLEEACRAADRLERLDEILRGRKSAWLELVPTSLDGSVVTVLVGNVLTEARQQQTTLKGLLAELRQSRAARATPAPPGAQPAPATAAPIAEGVSGDGVAGVTSLAQWVADHAPAAG